MAYMLALAHTLIYTSTRAHARTQGVEQYLHLNRGVEGEST